MRVRPLVPGDTCTRRPRARRTVIVLLLLTSSGAALLAACGGGDGGRPTATASPHATATNPADALDATVSALPPAGVATIVSPAEGATVRIPFVAAGSANIDATALVVQAIGGEGARLCERAVQAPPGTSLQGSWQVTMAFAAPGDGTATLRVLTRDAAGAEATLAMRALRLDAALAPIVVDAPACNAAVPAGTALIARGTAAAGMPITVELGGARGLVTRHALDPAAAGPDGRWSWEASFDLASVAPGAYELAAYTTGGSEAGPHDIFAVPVEVTP
jgi:hypothetical protein